jgi:uncharacterized protein YfdQ (DUF2303 family)
VVEINTTPEARAVADIVKENFRPIVSIFDEPKADKGAVLFVPRGLEAKSVKPFLDEYLQKPRRREGTAKLTELASFNAHVNRFKSSASAIFANNACQPQLIGVLDYHEEGATGDPAFCKHRAVYDFPLSDEWTAWTEKDSEQLGQQAFAEFIEDRLADVLDPAEAGDNAKAFASRLGMHFASASRLVELSRGLSIHVGATIRQAVNLGTGESQFTYVDQHQDEKGAPLKVPGAFIIAIPVFRGGDPYQIPVRLRYRVSGSQATWFYQLARSEETFLHAFREACEAAKTATSLPLFYGTPESV